MAESVDLEPGSLSEPSTRTELAKELLAAAYAALHGAFDANNLTATLAANALPSAI